MFHDARLYSIKKDVVLCHLCWNKCKIRQNERGLCNARINRDGKLYTLTYGNLSAMESRPIEIKPFFHFKPSTTCMTFSTYSCNFQCPWCQNWHLSKRPPPDNQILEPSEVIDATLKANDSGICASFNEPTLLFEYLLDLFPLARQSGLYCTMVSNGYMSPEALKMLRDAGLDAINMDVKGDDRTYGYCVRRGKSTHVWQNARLAVRSGLHLEMVNLIVPGVNDNEDALKDVVEMHLKYAGQHIPIHFTRYFPAFMFDDPPTKIEILEKAVNIAKKSGIEFPYIGNVPGHKYENTYCPECNEMLIQRLNYTVSRNKIKNRKCPNCRKEIYGVW